MTTTVELRIESISQSSDPAFGIQLVYNNTAYPELVTVRDAAVLMPSGFHPVPGHRVSFLRAMVAHREIEDR